MRQEAVFIGGEHGDASASAIARRQSNLGLALQLLELIAGRTEPIGAAELSAVAGLAGPKLQRGLNGLVEAGFISHDDVEQTYSLAGRSVYLASLIRNNAQLPRIAAPILEALAAETGETATLNAYLPKEGTAMIIAVAESEQSLRYALEPGEPLPLHAGAGGKAILAFLPPDEIARLLARHELAAMTRHTVTDRDQLYRDLATIRQDGYALANGERLLGAVEFAAPVFDAPDRIVGSLGVTAPEERVSPPSADCHGYAVRRQADLLSELLGCIRPRPVATPLHGGSSS